MKKLVSLIITVLLVSMVLTAFADVSPMPVLISIERFETTQEGDVFTIILDENASTGYTWDYKINKEDHVTFVSDESKTSSDLMGAPNKRVFTFKVQAKGVSTITFENSRSFEENSTMETLTIMVYKTSDKLFIEEDKIVTISTNDVMDQIELISYNPTQVYYNKTLLELDVDPQVIKEVTMIPLAETLRAMGYTVNWLAETQTVEISKGAQWTSITIGKNAYFKNRMSARPLSAAPTLVEGRTMVPAEFFSVILDLGIEIENGHFKLNDYPMGHYAGYVLDIQVDETGGKRISLVYDQTNEVADVIIHASSAFTYFNKTVEVGSAVEVVTSQITTMSMPPQTSGYVFY